MKKLHQAISSTLIAGLLTLSMPTAWAASGPSLEVSVLQGTVLEKTTSSEWRPVEPVVPAAGTWIQTEQNAAAVITFPEQVRFRLSEGTRLQVSSIEAGKLKYRVEAGRVFVTIPGETAVSIDGPHSMVQARSGSFVLDVSNPNAKLRVLAGNAQLSARQVSLPRLASLPAIASLVVPAGFEALALEEPGEAPEVSSDEPLEVAANEPPQQNPGQSPGSTNYNPGGQYGDFSTSAGQDEVKQDANNVVPWEPTTTTTGTGGGGGGSPLLLLGGLGGLGVLVALIGTGGSGDSGTPPGPYVAPPPGL
ncbi:hypothetical protein DYH09_29375 [bacterium CPR1]|nr:hypothetical protein [bacterium CPR1]